jgi:hypothetical protein
VRLDAELKLVSTWKQRGCALLVDPKRELLFTSDELNRCVVVSTLAGERICAWACDNPQGLFLDERTGSLFVACGRGALQFELIV